MWCYITNGILNSGFRVSIQDQSMSEEKSNNNLSLEIATESQIPLLLLVQDAFHKYEPSEKKEFCIAYEVANDPFSEDDFRNIVVRNECVILIDGDIPVGYMLLDSCSQTQGLKDFRQSIGDLIRNDLLDEEIKSFPRFVETLHPSLYEEHFKELRWQMLLFLEYTNMEKYKGVCFTFFTNANTLMEKIGTGWKIAFDNGLYYYLILEFSLAESEQ
jgi:hypothetical protein